MVRIVGVDELLVLLESSYLKPYLTGSNPRLGELVVHGGHFERTVADVVSELPKAGEDLND
jgi:hypothetical protein